LHGDNGELENDLLAGKTAVDGREGIELVFQGGGILGIEEPEIKKIPC
jgi:hypothetical protein